MKNNRQIKIQELLLAAADEDRPAKARILDLLKLIRWQKTGLGRPTRDKVIRLLRGIRAAAVVRNEQDVVELANNTRKQLEKYFNRRESVVIPAERNKKAIEKSLNENPGMSPGPPYPGYEWQYAVKDCRVIWVMVEETINDNV